MAPEVLSAALMAPIVNPAASASAVSRAEHPAAAGIEAPEHVAAHRDRDEELKETLRVELGGHHERRGLSADWLRTPNQ